jgi:hypothetical protein
MSSPRRASDPWRRVRRATPFGLLVLLAVLTVGLAQSSVGADHRALVGHGSSPGSASGGDPPTAPQNQMLGSFTIAGHVAGLFPGHTKRLVLTVTNPQAFAIVVTSMTTTVKVASVGCKASNLSISAFSGHLEVPAFGSAHTSVVASLAESAPNACAGSAFRLFYRGIGRRPTT